MKNIYKIEYWQCHYCKQTKTFTNKRKAQKWLKESYWWLDYDAGNCMIYIYKNGIKINWIAEDKGWKSMYY